MNCPDDSSSALVDSLDTFINNLPNELLAEIFSTVNVANRWQNQRKLPSPALLSSVCSHWRIFAQNIPELWVNINVPLHKSLEDCRRWTADWIARSGILPISVMINDTTSRSMLPHLANIMDLLSQHSERLRHLALHSRTSDTIQRALSLLRSASNLQQLTIHCSGYSSSWFQAENHSQQQYSLNFPRLTILKTEGSTVSPFPNLTSLTIGNLSASYRDISQYFTASPGLQHLTLYNLLPLEDPPPHDALIRVDSLRSLAVSLHRIRLSGRESPYIFKNIAMPNIKYLELGGAEWTVSDFGQSLSFAELNTLRISHRFSLSADTINFLHSFQTVRNLYPEWASTRGLLVQTGRGLTHNNFRSRSQRTTFTNLDITISIEQNQSVSASVWPELQIITLDTSAVDDVVNLCNFSTSARRHLSMLRRKGDSVYQRPLLSTASSEEGSDDVEEWLGKMVDIRTLLSPSVGLLGADSLRSNLKRAGSQT